MTGFVGSHVARHLLDAGAEVHALVRPQARLEQIPDLVDRLVLHEDDGGPLDERVREAAPEAVLHLATRFLAAHGPADVAPLVLDNVAFGARLADAAAARRVPFVNVGTAWQHVDGARYRPKNLYAATKQAFEDILAHYDRNAGLPVVTVNLFDTYGPHDHRGKLLAGLLGALRTGTPLDLSSGEQLIDLVHVDDVARALLRSAALLRAAEDLPTRCAASSGRPRSIREVVDVLGAVAGRPVPVRWGARPDRRGEMLHPWDAGPPVPGWVPRVDLEEGLRQLVAGDAGQPS